ncbi:MAG: hypothetical protein H7177_06860 [Rhizobacter sp.]|nr:hypothetical protein [Bacteriovorax sp.]
MTKLIIVLLTTLTLCSMAYADNEDDSITLIDRDTLFTKFAVTPYKAPVEKLKNVPLQEGISLLKLDVYNYAKAVEAKYMIAVKAPISHMVPSVTKEKIDKNIDDFVKSTDDLLDPKVNELVTQSVKEHLNVVQGRNMDPTTTIINDLYEETKVLKQRINTLEKKKTTSDDNLSKIAIGVAALAVLLGLFSNRAKPKKKA